MNPNPAAPCVIGDIDPVNGFYHALNGVTGKVVAKDVDTDIFVGIIVSVDSRSYALDGARIAERTPSLER
jgi:hypothetical protein